LSFGTVAGSASIYPAKNNNARLAGGIPTREIMDAHLAAVIMVGVALSYVLIRALWI